jgi:hypothetical protein
MGGERAMFAEPDDVKRFAVIFMVNMDLGLR